MGNRIRDVQVVNHRLDPHESELRIIVELEELTPTTQIKGRLMGPRNVYRSTVEVPYPLREIERAETIVLRVVIPEASWWEPKTPFLYQGAAELWQDGELCGRVEISHGIRWLQLTAKGLRLNGRPFVLRGKVVQPDFSPPHVSALRDVDMNSLLTCSSDAGVGSLSIADRFGCFVLVEWLGYLGTLLHCAKALNKHASCFGCIAHRSDWIDPTILKAIQPMLMGVDNAANVVPLYNAANVVPAGAAFLACKHDELVGLNDVALPKIVLTRQLPQPLPVRSDIIGWIESP